MNLNSIPNSLLNRQRISSLYQERAAWLQDVAAGLRQEGSITTASTDKKRIAVFGIDAQVGFVMPDASLAVPNAVDDMQRFLQFFYRNIENISSVVLSLDTHHIFQIFHPSFWLNPKGEHPQAFTVISSANIEAGLWTAVQQPEKALRYCQLLEKHNKKALIIWPYHTLKGGISQALVPAVLEAAILHSLLRQNPYTLFSKGEAIFTENYSVFEPDVCQIDDAVVGGFNNTLFTTLMQHERVYVWGEASSHCVTETLQSLIKRCQQLNRMDDLQRIHILIDCMSPVPAMGAGELDFPKVAAAALAEFAKTGMVLTTSQEVL
ncbi:MAG: hypothetical protein R8L53_05285 [Mariprofundales bacterium]